jgi:hypothetical protein
MQVNQLRCVKPKMRDYKLKKCRKLARGLWFWEMSQKQPVGILFYFILQDVDYRGLHISAFIIGHYVRKLYIKYLLFSFLE